MFAIIAFLCVILFISWSMLQERLTKRIVPPAFKGRYPILGHIIQMWLSNTMELFQTVRRLSMECSELGGVARFMAFGTTSYVITDPHDFATVASSCFEKHYFYKLSKPFLGNGLITANLTSWKQHRKLLNPAFSLQVLNEFIETFNDQSKKLVKHLGAEKENTLFDSEEYLAVNNLETVIKTLIGLNTEDNLSKEVFTTYLSSVKGFFDLMFTRFRTVWMFNDYLYSWSALKKRQDVLVRQIRTISSMVLNNKKKNRCDVSVINENFKAKAKPFLELLLELSSNTRAFTEAEVKDNIESIIFGGHDTTSTVLSYTLILLGSYQDVQEKLHTELMEVFDNSYRDVQKEDLLKLIYMEAVIKETMRLYPIAPVIGRYAHKAVTLRDFTIPAGSSYMLSIYAVHRHPIWGPDAHEFKPERWLDPAKLPADYKSYYAAFSVGKRGCIGKTYAMFAMKTTLAHLLRHYRVTADVTKVKLKLDPLLKSDSGYYLSIEKR